MRVVAPIVGVVLQPDREFCRPLPAAPGVEPEVEFMPADGRPGGVADDRRVHPTDGRALLLEARADEEPPGLPVGESRCRLVDPVSRPSGSHPSEREDRVLDVPDVLHHRYPEVVALPATGGEPEVDDREPGEREEHQHRDHVGEEAGGGATGEDGGIERRGPGEEDGGEGRDERDLLAGVVAGDDLEDDEYEREVDDREPEERPERLPAPCRRRGRRVLRHRPR